MWKRVAAGREFHFYLAGINNQNFLMRDRETGSWWQQINGKAIFGPLRGTTLELATGDELSFGLWEKESPGGQVLVEVPKYSKEYDSGWEPKVAKLPVVLNPGTLGARDVVIGLELGDTSRAYPMDALVKQSPVQDHIAGQSVLIAVGPDGKSVRVFLSRTHADLPTDLEFFRKTGSDNWLLVDSATGSEWELRGLRCFRNKSGSVSAAGDRAARLLVRLEELPSRNQHLPALIPAKPLNAIPRITSSGWVELARAE